MSQDVERVTIRLDRKFSPDSHRDGSFQLTVNQMTIINDQTPTSTLSAIQVGDQISNGLGTFGEVAAIHFDHQNEFWHFTFELVGGGFIEAEKSVNNC